MRRSWNDLRIGISGGACLMFAFFLLVLPLRWIFAAVTAAVVHEACHAFAVYLCGGRLHTLTVEKGGAVMVATPMTAARGFLCTMAGPLGSALMVLQTGTHPAALKDAVCSPAGTTIEAVEELERKGFRAAIMDAMKVCADKSRTMSK